MSERSPESDIELGGVNVAEEPGTVFLNDLRCYGMKVSLLVD
jgi:hypothetical protein